MGKKKIAVLNEKDTLSEEVKKPRKKAAVKESETEIEPNAEPTENDNQEPVKAETKKAREKKGGRSRKYKSARNKVDRDKLYPLTEAVSLVQETSLSAFEGKVELHATVQEAGLSGEIVFPYPTGKSQKIVIATDEVLEEVNRGKIDFDLLLATPEMMKKLAPLAKILGPKGLMPNPKKGTISDNPEKLATQLAGKTRFETEKKDPLIHLVVGKTKQNQAELVANIEAVLKAIGPTNIRKIVLKATMGPGVKVAL